MNFETTITPAPSSLDVSTRSIAQDRYDVTPRDYADFTGVSLRCAVDMFRYWEDRREPFICRAGVPTAKFARGKLLRMSRRYFEALRSK